LVEDRQHVRGKVRVVLQQEAMRRIGVDIDHRAGDQSREQIWLLRIVFAARRIDRPTPQAF